MECMISRLVQIRDSKRSHLQTFRKPQRIFLHIQVTRDGLNE